MLPVALILLVATPVAAEASADSEAKVVPTSDVEAAAGWDWSPARIATTRTAQVCTGLACCGASLVTTMACFGWMAVVPGLSIVASFVLQGSFCALSSVCGGMSQALIGEMIGGERGVVLPVIVAQAAAHFVLSLLGSLAATLIFVAAFALALPGAPADPNLVAPYLVTHPYATIAAWVAMVVFLAMMGLSVVAATATWARFTEPRREHDDEIRLPGLLTPNHAPHPARPQRY